MIPLKLQLKNFLSYGSELQEIDFGSYNLICLSGKNGHGKSALLDAMTWAIWGQARKVGNIAKADQGLLRLGQKQMMVIFDFVFNGAIYRARREYTSAYGKQYAYLDFGMIDEHDPEKIISLTGKTIRETQEKINSILSLDFESFVNSAFLRQGHSNEFSRKTPKERKEIICSILGLDKFEAMKKLALEKSREFAQKKDTLLQLQVRVEIELKQLETVQAQSIEVDTTLQNCITQEILLKQQQSTLEVCLHQLHEQINSLNILNNRLTTLKKLFAVEQTRALEQYKVWQAIHKKLLGSNAMQLEQEKKAITEQLQAQQETFTKHMQLKENLFIAKEKEQQLKTTFEKSIDQAIHQQKIVVEQQSFEQKLYTEKLQTIERQYQALQQQILLDQTLTAQLAAELVTLTAPTSDNMEKQFEKRKEFYHYMVALGNASKTTLADIVQKQELSQDEENPSCPLCMQNLSASRKKYLKTELQKQEHFYKHRIQRIKKLIPEVKELLVTLHQDVSKRQQQKERCGIIEQQQKDLQQKRALQLTELAQLEQEKNNMLHALQQSNAALQQMRLMVQALEKNKYKELEHTKEYVQATQEIALLTQAIQSLNFNQERFATLQQQAQQLDKQLQEIKTLQQQALAQKERIEQIATLIRQAKNLAHEINAVEKETIHYASVFEQEKEYGTQKELINKQLHTLVEEKQQLAKIKGTLEEKQKQFIALSHEHKENIHNINLLEKEIADYKEIAHAFSKDGIQALLIEEAIPEIENEANHLLERLTDNQSQVFIESLRDLKKGGSKETLDIKIADSAGIRDYELFSGGEAFRIDFALRIAISKLLAKRAGTSLQTLIIDEGFGSQDDEGLANIMECLYKIQEDFQKIIIVSHLPSMKDQFPVHFVVHKGAAGSMVHVIEQG